MIYFSYFGNWRKFPPGMKQIAICNFPPRGWAHAHLKTLAPAKEKFLNMKQGLCTFDELMVDYRSMLDDITDFYELEDDVILLCYERDPLECHRHVLMEKLISVGRPCCEIAA